MKLVDILLKDLSGDNIDNIEPDISNDNWRMQYGFRIYKEDRTNKQAKYYIVVDRLANIVSIHGNRSLLTNEEKAQIFNAVEHLNILLKEKEARKEKESAVRFVKGIFGEDVEIS